MPEVAEHEPASALDGGADGLEAYRTDRPGPAAAAVAGWRCRPGTGRGTSRFGRRTGRASGAGKRNAGRSGGSAAGTAAEKCPRHKKTVWHNELGSLACGAWRGSPRGGGFRSVWLTSACHRAAHDGQAARQHQRRSIETTPLGSSRDAQQRAQPGAPRALWHGPTTGKCDGISMNMKRMRGRGHRSGGGGGGGGMRHHQWWRQQRRYPAQPQPRVRQQWPGCPYPRHRAAAVREIPPARPRRDQQRRPGDGGGLFPACGALLPHPERDEPGASRPAADRAGPARASTRAARTAVRPAGPRPTPIPRKASSRAPGMGDQPESREIPIAAAPPEG